MDNIQNDPDLALAVAMSLSMLTNDESSLETTREVAEAQRRANLRTEQYLAQYGRTCVLDLGQYFGVTNAAVKTSFTNKCAVLCVWWALMIQRELGYCTSPAPYKTADYPTVHDLYSDLCELMGRISAEAKVKCKKCFGKDSKCPVCCKTYGRDESFPGELMGALSNLVGMSIYVWDIENERNLKFTAFGPDNTEYTGAKDPELVDVNRRIIIARLPGHYVLLPSMFRMHRSAPTSTDYNYNHVTSAIAKIGLVHKDRRGNEVSVGAPQPIYNLGPGGVSYTNFTDGGVEPRFSEREDPSVKEALRLHIELNGKI